MGWKLKHLPIGSGTAQVQRDANAGLYSQLHTPRAKATPH